MKVVAVLTELPKAGGGYSQSLNGILQMQRVCAGRHEFEVVCTHAENLAVLRDLGLQARCHRLSALDMALTLLHGNVVWQTLHRRFRLKGPFEKMLSRIGCDLVYFAAPVSLPMALQASNYITTLWDICHLEHPEFPEVRDFHTRAMRERVYQAALGGAVLVLVDSVRLGELAAFHYRVGRGRLLAMPFAPSPLLRQAAGAVESGRVDPEKAPFFYPANFWAHKNHIRILQALVLLARQGWRPEFVFCGNDEGNLAHLQRFVTEHGLAGQVRFVGFIDAASLASWYRSALAVVMPTYFGQTNLPPLEAWSFGVPLIYSASLSEQAGDAALLVDADDAGALAEAMSACRDEGVRERLREAGYRRLAVIDGERVRAEKELISRLDAYAARRECGT